MKKKPVKKPVKRKMHVLQEIRGEIGRITEFAAPLQTRTIVHSAPRARGFDNPTALSKPLSGVAADRFQALHELADKHGLLCLHEEQRLAVAWAEKELESMRRAAVTAASEQKWLEGEVARLRAVLIKIGAITHDEELRA